MISSFLVLLIVVSHATTQNPDTQGIIDDIFSPKDVIDGTTQGPCECVLYYLCKNGTINSNGEDIIDIRLRECPHYLETCCGAEDIQEGTPPPDPAKELGCGFRNPNGVGFRIKEQVDSEAEYGEFPWMVGIFTEQESTVYYQCGGALIHPNVVLTAAHCVKKKKSLKVRVGEWDTQTTNELFPYQDRNVDSMKIHTEYYAGALFNDVALLFLDKPVQYDQHINVLCLPPQGTIVNDKDCFSSGWGKDSFGREGKYQALLKKILLPIVPHDKCEADLRETRLGAKFKLHDSFVCAGGEEGKDTCKGDGGGPLVCPIPGHKDRYYQIGMVAWGIGCGGLDIPGVYVNVAKFRDWIDAEMGKKMYDTAVYQYQ